MKTHRTQPLGQFALWLMVLAAACPAIATATDEQLGPKIDALFAEHDAWDRPGLAIAAVQDGELLYARGYGCANLEYDIPITPATVFHVASVSKQFTCFAIVLLAEEGKLALDDDVRKYLPDDVPDFGPTITLRHLMNHTSGIRDQWALLAMAGWRLDDVITREHILKLMRRQQDLNFEPGAEYLYSNMGYTLLAEVVAKVSGQPFRQFTAERIFKPLGMTHTHFHDDHEEIVPHRAYSYSPGADGFRKSVLSFANVGATSLFTTAEDLARWLTNLDNGAVGGSHALEQMHTQGVLNDGKHIDYALGLSFGKYRGQRTVGHGGSDAGFRSHVLRFPGSKLGIVVLSNLASIDTQRAALRIAKVVLGDKLDSDDKQLVEDVQSDKPAHIAVQALRNYVGTYQLDDGGMTEVKLKDEKLVAQLPGGPEMEMIPQLEYEFLVKEVQARVKFAASDGGPVPSFTATVGDTTLQGTRVETSAAAELEPLAGKYYSEELATTYELVVRDGKLIVGHQRQPDVELTHVRDDVFGGGAWYLQKVEFQRDEEGNVVGLNASSNRVHNLKFERR
jgi:CubicO group peptidase (beta-lactamase class C family)